MWLQLPLKFRKHIVTGCVGTTNTIWGQVTVNPILSVISGSAPFSSRKQTKEGPLIFHLRRTKKTLFTRGRKDFVQVHEWPQTSAHCWAWRLESSFVWEWSPKFCFLLYNVLSLSAVSICNDVGVIIVLVTKAKHCNKQLIITSALPVCITANKSEGIRFLLLWVW